MSSRKLGKSRLAGESACPTSPQVLRREGGTGGSACQAGLPAASFKPSKAAPSPFTEVACDLLARGHAIRFRAPGCSMAPAILDGQVVTVEPVRPAEVQINDIILYRAARGVIAHRVVAIVGQASACDAAAPVFLLRGDAPNSPEERVEARRILGRVSAVEPKSLGARLLRTARLGAGRLKRRISGLTDLLTGLDAREFEQIGEGR